MYKRIVLAYDGSQPGQKALLDGDEIAQWSRSELFLVAVMPPPAALIGGEGFVYDARGEEEERKRYEAILGEGLRKLAESGHRARGEVVVGDAVDEITRYAREVDADLIVVGHKHLDSWAARWWRGSVSKTLIEHAPCSVLVVITR
jgi:nucleotide-binding universal stress UspA family protein